MADDSDGVTRRRYLGALSASLVGGAAGCSAADDGESTTTTPSTGSDPADSNLPGDTTAGESVFTRVYRDVVDSVVLVRVFRATAPSQGSGWLFDDGTIVTNHHVVEDAETIRVRFDRGEWREASVVGTDPYSDLAALAVDDQPAYVEALSLVEEPVVVGQHVMAIGTPFGFEQSATAGIVSGTNRSIPAADDNPNNFRIPDAIQTDAAANPGNSGGPLVTLDRRVAGVVNSGGGENIAFAISAPLVERVVPSLVETGEYHHSYMGVRLVGVTPLIAEANDLPAVEGVLIVDVLDDGPSDGVLQPSTGEEVVDGVSVPAGGDVIVRMGDTPIPTQQALSTYLALETSPGDTIPVEVLRDGERRTVELTLGRRPPPS